MFLAIYRLHVDMHFDFFRKYSYTLAFEFDRKHYLSVYFFLLNVL